jgi:hypothetical protein
LEKSEVPEKKLNGWLYGWKDIAEYVGCSAKQAQYYAAKHHLPIVRLPNNKPAAKPSEIDHWMRARSST